MFLKSITITNTKLQQRYRCNNLISIIYNLLAYSNDK